MLGPGPKYRGLFKACRATTERREEMLDRRTKERIAKDKRQLAKFREEMDKLCINKNPTT